jgi:hypothetical protein
VYRGGMASQAHDDVNLDDGRDCCDRRRKLLVDPCGGRSNLRGSPFLGIKIPQIPEYANFTF